MAHRAEGVQPAGAPVGLGLGGGTRQVVCGHPQMEAPPRGEAEGGTGEAPATMEGAQCVAEGTQDQETTWQKGPVSATPQLCEQGQALALSEPVSSPRLRTRGLALAGTAGPRQGGQSRQVPWDEKMLDGMEPPTPGLPQTSEGLPKPSGQQCPHLFPVSLCSFSSNPLCFSPLSSHNPPATGLCNQGEPGGVSTIGALGVGRA